MASSQPKISSKFQTKKSAAHLKECQKLEEKSCPGKFLQWFSAPNLTSPPRSVTSQEIQIMFVCLFRSSCCTCKRSRRSTACRAATGTESACPCGACTTSICSVPGWWVLPCILQWFSAPNLLTSPPRSVTSQEIQIMSVCLFRSSCCRSTACRTAT